MGDRAILPDVLHNDNKMTTKNRLRALLAACSLPLACCAAAEVPPAIQERLRQAGLPDDALAFVAQRASDGRTVASHGPDRSVQPASTLKLLTSIVALERLGPAYRGRTLLLASGPVTNGVLHGDLVLRGEGDVDFDAQALEQVLRVARLKGVRDIRGDLVLDRTFFEPARTDVGLPPFDETPEFRYNVVPDALLLNTNLMELVLVSDTREVRVGISTPLEGVSVKSRLTLVDGDCDSWDDGWQLPEVRTLPRGRIEVVLLGTYPRDCKATTGINVIDRVNFAERMLRAMWKDLGGTFRGRARDGATPAGASVLATHRSRPLSQVVHDIDKSSDNPIARVVYLSIGAASPGEAPTASRAEASVRRWMAENRIDDAALVLENGSGLSRLERTTAAQLAAVLRAALASPWAPEFMASIPVVGADIKTRLRGVPASANARLKTGTLRNSSALAGYVKDRDGSLYIVVAVLNDDAARKEVARPILDALVESLLTTGFAGTRP